MMQADFTHLYQQAVEMRVEALGARHPKVAASLIDLGLFRKAQGDARGAAEALTRAVAILDPGGGARLGEALVEWAALRDPAAVVEQVARGMRLMEVDPKFAPAARLGITLNNLASALEERETALAERMYRLAVRIQRAFPADAEFASTLTNYGSLLSGTGRPALAEPFQRQALRLFQEMLGAQHPRVAVACSNLGTTLAAKGQLAEAESLFRQALGIDLAVYGRDHAEVRVDRENLADLLEKRGKKAEAATLRKP